MWATPKLAPSCLLLMPAMRRVREQMREAVRVRERSIAPSALRRSLQRNAGPRWMVMARFDELVPAPKQL